MKNKEKQLTPQQASFLALYFDPHSDTYANATKSAIEAGFSEEYAQNITHLMPDWLSESIGKHGRMLMKAEKRLEAVIDSKTEKNALDASKFVASTIGRRNYSTRSEQSIDDPRYDREIELLEQLADGKTKNDDKSNS